LCVAEEQSRPCIIAPGKSSSRESAALINQRAKNPRIDSQLLLQTTDFARCCTLVGKYGESAAGSTTTSALPITVSLDEGKLVKLTTQHNKTLFYATTT
jgi:hypothetical protein